MQRLFEELTYLFHIYFFKSEVEHILGTGFVFFQKYLHHIKQFLIWIDCHCC